MLSLMLSEYTNDAGKRVATVLCAGSPLCPETDRATALAILERAQLKLSDQKLRVQSWDGDTGVLTDGI